MKKTTSSARLQSDRRQFLKGLGVTIPAVALPLLRSSPLFAATAPVRLVVLFTPNGTILDTFWPTGAGTTWTIPAGGILEPLMPWKAKMNVLHGVHYKSAEAGPGAAHQKGPIACLTGGHALNGNMNGGNNSPSGYADRISVDQYIATKWGNVTRLSTVEAGISVSEGGNRHAISYLGANQPVFPTSDPAKVFDRVFANFAAPAPSGGTAPDGAAMQLLAERKSVLDYVNSDLTRLANRLPGDERVRLDRHLDSLRELERQIAPTVVSGKGCAPAAPAALSLTDAASYPMVTKAQLDNVFMTLACDQSRLVHVVWNGETSQQTFPWLGINDPHHTMSHVDDGNKPTHDKLTKVNNWYAQQVAYLVGKMDAVVESNGKTMLDNSLVIWTNGLGKGNNHSRDNIPWALLGSAGGYLATGRYLQFNNAHNDLLVTILNAMGLRDEKTFGDASLCKGPLPGLPA
jgi:hypothetical protein